MHRYKKLGRMEGFVSLTSLIEEYNISFPALDRPANTIGTMPVDVPIPPNPKARPGKGKGKEPLPHDKPFYLKPDLKKTLRD